LDISKFYGYRKKIFRRCRNSNCSLAMGGSPTTGVNTNATEEYDGSAWAGGGNLGNSRRGLNGAGIQTAALAIGGETTVKTGTN
jgi:hypothetical protein